jgi:hypothetical protein
MNFYDEDEFSEDFDEYNSYLHREQYYCQKALSALNLEVAKEDVFRTELRRSSHKAMLNGGRENLGGMLLSQYYSILYKYYRTVTITKYSLFTGILRRHLCVAK